MSNVYEMPERADPIGEASHWIAIVDRGMDDQEEKALREWLAAAPENPAALMEVARLWDRMETLSRLADLFPQPAADRHRSPGFALAIAAGVLVAVLAGMWSIAERHPADSNQQPAVAETAREQIFQTAVGEHSTVNLPDGSQVALNTNTLIKVLFTDHRRLLLLERGEVYVEVAHDRTRPLSVYAGDKVVQAVGTAFNLEITQDRRIALIVTEGRVLVGVIDQEVPIAPDAQQPPPARPETAVTVSAGEQILLEDGNGQAVQVAPEDIEVKLSWRGGNLVFRGESLADALAEIERYTPVEFVILDEDLKMKRIVGMFKAGDVDGLLATLRQNFAISYQRVSDDKVMLSNMRMEQ